MDASARHARHAGRRTGDPYDPLRGYALTFTYRGIGNDLPGYRHDAADRSTAYVVLAPPARPGDPARPVRIVPAATGLQPNEVALRVRYDGDTRCRTLSRVMRRFSCLALAVRPNTWYVDERSREALGRALRDGRAVADLRVAPNGEASLLRLRVGHGTNPGDNGS